MARINPFPLSNDGNLGLPAQSGSQPGTFRRILGAAVGIAGNVFAPGIGSTIGQLISGGANTVSGTGPGALAGDSMQYLQLQQQILTESRSFEMVSNVLKARHDAAMSAIRNLH